MTEYRCPECGDPEHLYMRAERTEGPGELITMMNGAVWFHPYSGAAPTLLKVAVETGRLVIVKG